MLAGQGSRRFNRQVNARRQGIWIVIAGAAENASVSRVLTMQPFKIPAIVRQHCAAVRSCVGKNLSVTTASSARFLDRDHVVPQTTQTFDGEVIEILIGVKRRHRASRLRVFANRFFDLVWMNGGILPGRFQIGLSQTLNAVPGAGVRQTPSPPLN
jgi:hypothetical protein